jgi:hypothetical protein
MIKGMGKQYPGSPKKCRKMSDGKDVCISKKAWNVFFATVTKRYGSGAEEKPKTKKVEETDTDYLIKWYIRRLKNGSN